MKSIIHKYFLKNINNMLQKKNENIYIKQELGFYFGESDKEVSEKESFNAKITLTFLLC